MNRKWHTLLVLVGLLTALLPLMQAPVNISAQGTTTITIAPTEVGVGQAAFVEGRIACGVAEGCGAFTIDLTFNRDMLRVHSAQIGPFLGAQVFNPVNIIDNEVGTITLAAAAMQPPPPGAGDVLFRLEIGGLVPGSAAVEVTSAVVQNVNGEEIPTSGTGTVITVIETGIIPLFSPPGAWDVVFVSDRDGNPEIYAIHADATGLRRLTDHPALDGGPTWSPGGGLIAFHTERDGNAEIYTMDDGGGSLTRLTNDPAPDTQPAWHPNGSQIAFVAEREGSPDIFVMNADGSNVQRITSDPGTEQQPAWSPDGRQIAYIADSGGTFEVFLINADGSGTPQQVTALSGTNGWWPAWKPDGTLLSFTNEENGLADIMIIGPDGANPARLTETPNLLTSPDWSPDERFLVFISNRTGTQDVFVLDVAQNHWFRLTDDPAVDTEPDWRALGPSGPCLIRTSNNDVAVRVGPGLFRSEFTRLIPDQDYEVISQFEDQNGELWYELDKTQVPGHENVNGLWVFSGDVEAIGACGAVDQGTPPPIVPLVPDTPGDDDDDDWGPCGSCNTCGHPANECVSTPDGECVWDPRTCGEPPPPVTKPPGDDDDDRCYFLTLTYGPNGQAQVVTPPNCGNGYNLGSNVLIRAWGTGTVAQFVVTGWSGSCASMPTPNFQPSQTDDVTINGDCNVHVTFGVQ